MYSYPCEGTFVLKLMSFYIHIELIWNLRQMDLQIRLCYTRVYMYLIGAKFLSYNCVYILNLK
jgi:hypothetical protein